MTHDRATDQFEEALLEDDPVQLYERAPCGYVSTTPDGRLVKVNGTFATWTRYDTDDLLGRSFIDLLSVGGRVYYETHYAPSLRLQGSVREIALEIVRGDGTRLPVLVNARLDRDSDGEPRVVRIAVFDATERRAYERELLRAKEAAEQSELRARTLARTLQETLIPPTPPVIQGLDVAAAYRPAGDGTEVGGDFYDVFPLANGEWMVALGDVSGKGAAAAVVTALARYTLRALSVSHDHPSEMLARLDEAILRHETDRFCTLVIVRLRRAESGWTAVVSSGGHPPCVLIRSGEKPEEVFVPGTMVGILKNATFTDRELYLGPGDTLVLYSDGVTEARNGSEQFGSQRLVETVTRLTRQVPGPSLAQSLVSGIVDEVLDFQSGLPHDDIAILALSAP